MLPSFIVIIISSTSLCVAIIQIYGLFHFKSLKHLHIIRRRYPAMIEWESIAVILYLLIALPLLTYERFHETDVENTLSNTAQNALSLSADISNFVGLQFISNIEASRLFLIHYDLQYLRSSKEWKVLIDSHYADKDWYLRNRIRWGNQRYVLQKAALYFVCSLMATLPLRVIAMDNASLKAMVWFLEAVLLIPPVTLTLIVYYKTPKKLDDLFYFHAEYRTTIITMCFGYFVYVCCILAWMFGLEEFSKILGLFLPIFILSVPSLISTVAIPLKIRSNVIWVCVTFYISASIL